MDYKKIGEFLKSLRKAKGLTQEDVADALYVTQKTVSRWETGEGVPDINILTTVASFYDVSVDELLNGERQKPNQSSYTLNLKEGEKLKLLKNNVIKKSNAFGIASISTMGFMFLLSLIIGLFASEIAGFVISILGIASGLFIFFYGFKISKEKIYESDIDISKEEKDKVKLSIHKSNIIFIDVMAAIIILSAILLTIYLLPVYDYGNSPFIFVFSIMFDFAIILLYLVFRHDSVIKCDYSYRSIRRSLVIGLGIIEILAMLTLFTITLAFGDISSDTETIYISMIVISKYALEPYTAKIITMCLDLILIIGIIWMMIKARPVIQSILALTSVFVQFIALIDVFYGDVIKNYDFRGIMPSVFGVVFTILSITLLVVILKLDKKSKNKENLESI